MKKILIVLLLILSSLFISCNSQASGPTLIDKDYYQDSYITITLIKVTLGEKLLDGTIDIEQKRIKGTYYYVEKSAVSPVDLGEDNHRPNKSQEYNLIIFLEQGIVEKINTKVFYTFQYRRNISIGDKVYTLINIVLDRSKPDSFNSQYYDFLAYEKDDKLRILDEDCGYIRTERAQWRSMAKRWLMDGASIDTCYESTRKIAIDASQFIVNYDNSDCNKWYLCDVLSVVSIKEKIIDKTICLYGEEIAGAYYRVKCNTLSNYSFFDATQEKCIFIANTLLSEIDTNMDLFLITSCPDTLTTNNTTYQVIYELLDENRPDEIKKFLWDYAAYIVDGIVRILYIECGYLSRFGIAQSEEEYLLQKGIVNGINIEESIIYNGNLF